MSTRVLAGAILAATSLRAPPSMACDLMPPDAVLLKKAMAGEIAFRLAIKVEQVALDDITTPELHRPFALGPDCSGLASFHHSAGFRVAVATQQHAFVTLGKPHSASGTAARHRARVAAGFYSQGYWPGVWRNFRPAPKTKPTPDVDYSGYRRWPQYPDTSQFPGPPAPQSPTRWSTLSATPAQPLAPGLCHYEGMAVVLGYGSASPVAVNFTQQCD